jgi:hypothetical protein
VSIKRSIPGFLLLLVILSSCDAAYVANIRHTPLFTAKNQVEASIASSTNFQDFSGEAHAAYSLTNHFAIMANGLMVSQRSDGYRRQHYLTEGAIGYFAKDDARRYEVFAGYGVGSDLGRNRYSFFNNDIYLVKSRYVRFFIQPSICTRLPSTRTNVIFTFRTSFLRPDEFVTRDLNSPTMIYRPDRSFQVLIEPAVTTSFWINNSLRCYVQGAINVPFDTEDYYQYFPFQVAFGLQFSNIR